jgi:hypothetical protein
MRTPEARMVQRNRENGGVARSGPDDALWGYAQPHEEGAAADLDVAHATRTPFGIEVTAPPQTAQVVRQFIPRPQLGIPRKKISRHAVGRVGRMVNCAPRMLRFSFCTQVAALAGCAILVAACSSTPPRSGTAAGPPPATSSKYYKDDGPGDSPPANLDQIADAMPRLEPLNRFASRP